MGDAGNKISLYLKVRPSVSLLLAGNFLGKINRQLKFSMLNYWEINKIYNYRSIKILLKTEKIEEDVFTIIIISGGVE